MNTNDNKTNSPITNQTFSEALQTFALITASIFIIKNNPVLFICASRRTLLQINQEAIRKTKSQSMALK